MFANARKDNSSPYFLYRPYLCWKALFQGSSITSVLVCTFIPRPSNTSCKSLIHVSTYRVQISLPAALRLLWVLIIPNLLLLLCCVNEAKFKISLFPWVKLSIKRKLSWGCYWGWGNRLLVWANQKRSIPGAYYPTRITPPAMLSFDWLRGIQDYKKCKFGPKMEWNINSRPTLGP